MNDEVLIYYYQRIKTNLVDAEGSPLIPRSKPKASTGPVTQEEVLQAEQTILKSGTATEAKQKGVRKAALEHVARSWSGTLQHHASGEMASGSEVNYDAEDNRLGSGLGSASFGGSVQYEEMTRDELLRALVKMVSIRNSEVIRFPNFSSTETRYPGDHR